MANYQPLPSQKELLELFSYNEQTGELTWRVHSKNNQRRPGDPVGKRSKSGYLEVKLNGKWYKAHRLIWVMMHDVDPGSLMIDHIDHDTTNNRISNLRTASYSQNAANSLLRKDKKPGRGKGVKQLKGKFYAYCGAPPNRKSDGPHETAQQAHAAYCRMAAEMFGDYAFGGTNHG